MAFKIKPPYSLDNTPIYHVDMEDGVLGKANNNGTIIINDKVGPDKIDEVTCSRKSTHRTNEVVILIMTMKTFIGKIK